MERKVNTRIGPDDHNTRVIDFLSRRFTYHPRETWQQQINEGRIYINGAPASSNTLLQTGDCLAYKMPPITEPPVEYDFEIAYEDNNVLAVAKPPNLPCHPSGSYFRNTLWALLQGRGLDKVRFVHRLDRETSGVVLLAKDASSARALEQCHHTGRMHKEYLVLVFGCIETSFQAEGFLMHDLASAVRKKQKFIRKSAGETHSYSGDRTKFAATYLTPLRCYKDMTLLRAVPITGRYHQVRATLCSLGYPLVGDKMYGPDERLFIRFLGDQLSEEDWQQLRTPYQALHAARLAFPHPVTGTETSVTADLPATFFPSEV